MSHFCGGAIPAISRLKQTYTLAKHQSYWQYLYSFRFLCIMCAAAQMTKAILSVYD